MNVNRTLVWIMRFGMLLFWMVLFGLLVLFARQSWYGSERSITVLSWSVMFDPEHIAAFERETGIRVHTTHYESNEELFVKLRTTGGVGFDLVAPSDYAVQKLIAEGLIKPLDHTQLSVFEMIHPALLGHSFDPENRFSIPYIWGVYTLVWDSRYFIPPIDRSNWALLFPEHSVVPPYRVVMTNDPLEGVALASLYLFKSLPFRLDATQTTSVQKLLSGQKRFVEHYGNVRADFALITGSAQVALMPAGEALRAVRLYNFLRFYVPRPALMTIEHCAIPRASSKDAMVYQFLNYMFSPRVLADHFAKTGDLPARQDSAQFCQFTPAEAVFFALLDDRKLHPYFVSDILSERARFDLWLSVKS